MIATDVQLTRLIETKLLLDLAQREFYAASRAINLTPLDEQRVVEYAGVFYLITGKDNGRAPAITPINAPRSLE
jgi:hypothetical protein